MIFSFYPYAKNGEYHIETRKIETYEDILRCELLDWIKRRRDELITSMIDDMSEEEFQKVKSEVDGKPFSYAEERKKLGGVEQHDII